MLNGRSVIRAADPAQTRILGNFKIDYKASAVTCEQYPWFSRTYVKSHIQIECDPTVWNQVEALIRSKLAR